MIHQEGSFTNHMQQVLYHQSWLPESQIKAQILIIHGLHEHSGRYDQIARFFAGQGFAVHAMDLPGHGKSQGTRSYIESWDDYLRSILSYLKLIQSNQPGHPVYLLGHSLGGTLGATFLIVHQDQVAGAVLSGAITLVPDYVNQVTIMIGKILSKVLPKFRIIPLEKENISQDPEVVRAYLEDPLVFQGRITARLSAELNGAIQRIAREGSRIEVPLLLLHGTEDRLSDPACSEFLLDRASSADKQLISYPGFYHEVYNEPDARIVFNDVLDWISTRTP